MDALKFVAIPGAEDADKTVFIEEVEVGTVSKGWLRLGGNQWVYAGHLGASFGHPTLAEMSRDLLRRHRKLLA